MGFKVITPEKEIKKGFRVIEPEEKKKKKKPETAGSLIKGLGFDVTKEDVAEFAKDTPFQKIADATTGFGEGATLGASRLIPAVKEEADIAKERSPKSFALGEVASFLTPGTLGAKAFKTGGKVAAKAVPKVVGKAGEKLAPKIARAAIQSGIGSGAAGAVKGTLGEGGFDPVEGIKKGAVEGLTGAAISAGLTGVGGVAKKKAVELIQSSFKPKDAIIAKGFKPENVLKHNVSGTFEDTIKKTGKKITAANEASNKIIDTYAKNNPGKTFDADGVFLKVVDDIENSRIASLAGGDKKGAINAVMNMAEAADDLGIGKSIDIKQLKKLKGLIGKKAFVKGRSLASDSDIEKRLALKELYIDLLEQMGTAIPEIKAQNKIMSELIPVQDAAESAAKRFGNRNKILSLSNIAFLFGGGLGAVADSPEALALAGAGAAVTSVLQKGRGAHLASKAGDVLGKEAVRRLPSVLGAKKAGSFLDKKQTFTGTLGRNQ